MAEQYNSNFTGPEIDAILGNAVRYDLAQSLSSAQQAQARDNINAAPGGYGLGAVWNVAPSRDADLITGSGFQMAVLNTPTGNSWWGILSFVYDADSATQWAMPQNTAAYYGSVCKREKRAGTWTPWEWVNPPLALGVEYRTTERYLGKPVYVKLVNPVHAVMTSETAVDLVCYFGVSNIAAVVSCVPVTGEWKNGAIVSPINNVPFLHSIATSSNLRIVCTGMATNYVRYNFSGYDGDYGFMPLIKYTKTTD